MLSLKEIGEYYPESLRGYKEYLLKEYLQYKILEIIFNTDFANKLTFIGGTSIRIVHNINRFSEDLDFDNFDLNETDFKKISETVKRKLELEGYEVEVNDKSKKSINWSVKFLNILYQSKISGHKEQKVHIKLQTEPHKFDYRPNKFLLNKFEVFTQINTAPMDILLSMKIYAIFNRKRDMGRDFYDTIFLFGKTKPNYDYLKFKVGIENIEQLKTKLLEKSKRLNFKLLANDVRPYLANPEDMKKVLLFPEFIKTLS